MNKKGFTLIELLIVIAIMAIIASVIFVALNPLQRFQDSRDSVRWQQASQILNAIKLQQVDNGGYLLSDIAVLSTSTNYMITASAVGSGCDDQNSYCTTDVDADGACVDLSQLVTDGYLSAIPFSPTGEYDWASSDLTGYTLEKTESGAVFIRACENENSSEIVLSR
ncbi:MAG TPA: hypothetical protein DEB09_04655 [Candidatus Magasanikbacteria bacterium]|nr:hypothetical protein [Candidatus Magasanikbacteria bacterium]